MVFWINLSVSSFIGSLMEHRQWLDVSFKEFLLEAIMDLRFIFLGISLISKVFPETWLRLHSLIFSLLDPASFSLESYHTVTRVFAFTCTAWKVSICRVFSGPYFPAFGLNTERYLRISPYSVRARKNTDQKKLRIWTLFTQCDYTESKNRAIISYYHGMILLAKRRI